MRIIVWIIVFVLSLFSANSSKDAIVKDNNTKKLDNKEIRELCKEKKYEQAENIVSEYLTEHPDDSLALGNKAYILISKDQNQEGIIVLNALLVKDPDNDSVLNNLSWAYNNLGLYKLALEYAEKALEVDSVDGYHFLNKGNALYGMKKYDEALECYNSALTADDTLQNAYYGKGLCLNMKKEYEQAFLSFKKAFEIDPSDYDYYNKLISSCERLEKYDDMISFSDKKINMDSEDPDAYYYKAQAYGYLNQYEKAIENYDICISYSDYAADAYYEKCLIYLKLDKKDAAYESLKNALYEDEEYIEYIDLDQLEALKGYKDFDKLIQGENNYI